MSKTQNQSDTMSQEQQEKYFNDANESVKRNAFYMQQSLDQENLHEALRHASTMINELRTSRLFPSRYYELYMNVTNQLTHLESYINDEYRKKLQQDEKTANKWLLDLYDRVQFCGNIVPRLYLLITVGSICIKSSHANRNNNSNTGEEIMKVLFDLVSLSKGVQHPTRGLFLRNYLSQISRLYLPDIGDGAIVENIEEYGVQQQAVDFVLQNFGEMTRLWVRMQHQGAVRDRVRREKERLQLRMLVGTNLRRLSELNCISKQVYKNYVLKKLAEQIIKCKDKIAQEYLMECIIMVFGDDYHLATLDEFLQIINKLHASVNVNAIIIKLMERLARFAEGETSGDINTELNRKLFQQQDVFEKFQKYCNEVIEKHPKMTIDEILSLKVELVNFASQCYPGKDEYIATIVKETVAIIEKNKNIPNTAIPHVHRMLVAPLKSMNLRVLNIPEYCQLITYISIDDVKRISNDIIEALVTQDNVCIEEPIQVEKLFGIIEPLIIDPKLKKKINIDDDDDKQGGKGGDSDDEHVESNNNNNKEEKKNENVEQDEEFEREQNNVAKLINLIYNKNTDIHYKTLHLSRKYFGQGGEIRLHYTCPALIFNCLKLIQRTHKKLVKLDEKNEISIKPKKMFQFVHRICLNYSKLNPEIGVRLWLQCGFAADACGFSDISYEFLSQAYLCFEENVSNSDEQYEALRCIISTLQQINNLDQEKYDTLRSKAIQHSNRLLKKHAASRCFALTSHLYWDCKYTNGDLCNKSLTKACKRANQMVLCAEMIEIFVEVLNKYIYFIIKKNQEIETDKISGLISIIKEKINELTKANNNNSNNNNNNDKNDKNDEDGSLVNTNERLEEVKQFFRLTCQYIKDLSMSDTTSIAAAFKNIEV